MLIKGTIAQSPKNSKHVFQNFNLTQDQPKKVFLLPHEVALELLSKSFLIQSPYCKFIYQLKVM